ncbi:unnamed protein product, partial [Amoebophrya sp. A120]
VEVRNCCREFCALILPRCRPAARQAEDALLEQRTTTSAAAVVSSAAAPPRLAREQPSVSTGVRGQSGGRRRARGSRERASETSPVRRDRSSSATTSSHVDYAHIKRSASPAPASRAPKLQTKLMEVEQLAADLERRTQQLATETGVSEADMVAKIIPSGLTYEEDELKVLQEVEEEARRTPEDATEQDQKLPDWFFQDPRFDAMKQACTINSKKDFKIADLLGDSESDVVFSQTAEKVHRRSEKDWTANEDDTMMSLPLFKKLWPVVLKALRNAAQFLSENKTRWGWESARYNAADRTEEEGFEPRMEFSLRLLKNINSEIEWHIDGPSDFVSARISIPLFGAPTKAVMSSIAPACRNHDYIKEREKLWADRIIAPESPLEALVFHAVRIGESRNGSGTWHRGPTME